MLKDILEEIRSEHAEDISTSAERTYHLRKVNWAAEYIYNLGDIWGTMEEEVFDFNVATAQVTLPEYVGHVRGARYYDYRIKTPLDAMGNRYNNGLGNELWYLNLREKLRTPLSRNISNQSTLKASIPLDETSPIIVDIVGPTHNSARFKESITIPTGSLSVEGIANFRSPLYSLRKNRKTSFDVTIKDAENNILAIIPNHQYISRYHVYQVFDDNFSLGTNATDLAIEVWFKKRFVPFVDDEDIFVGGEEYEHAIVKLYAAARANDTDIRDKLIREAMKQVGDIHKDHDSGKIKKFVFSANPYFHIDYVNSLTHEDSWAY